jgi:hypothetical protein
MPALQEAGFKAIPPTSKGSELIHADIITHLVRSDLVLCDMSTLNPNVFFELGVRTSLNKPVCLIVDDKTKKIPFDTGIINRITYPSHLRPWNITKSRNLVKKHLEESIVNCNGINALWKYFGIIESGEFKASETTQEEKIDYIIRKIEHMNISSQYDKMSPDRLVRNVLTLDALYAAGAPFPWGSTNPVRIDFNSERDYQLCIKNIADLPNCTDDDIIKIDNKCAIELKKDGFDDELNSFFESKGIKARIFSRP